MCIDLFRPRRDGRRIHIIPGADMLKKIITLLVLVLISAPASAETKVALTDLFENVCIGSQINPAKIPITLSQAASVYKMKLKELPQDQIETVSPGAKNGWGIYGDKATAFIVVFGQRSMENGKISNNCSITTNDTSAKSEVRSFVETKFQSRKVIDQRQGSSDILMYTVDLFGFSRRTGISIQATEGASSDLQMLVLSLFEIE